MKKKARSRGAKTKAQKKVSDTARWRVEKLHADEKFERMTTGVKHRRSERAAESARREKRMAARRRNA